jgi:hypothetical protein
MRAVFGSVGLIALFLALVCAGAAADERTLLAADTALYVRGALPPAALAQLARFCAQRAVYVESVPRMESEKNGAEARDNLTLLCANVSVYVVEPLHADRQLMTLDGGKAWTVLRRRAAFEAAVVPVRASLSMDSGDGGESRTILQAPPWGDEGDVAPVLVTAADASGNVARLWHNADGTWTIAQTSLYEPITSQTLYLLAGAVRRIECAFNSTLCARVPIDGRIEWVVPAVMLIGGALLALKTRDLWRALALSRAAPAPAPAP